MTSLPEHIYKHGDTPLSGRVARPKAGGARPGVLIFHHAMGQCEHDCERAQDLANEGYVVLVTDMYGTGQRELGADEYMPLVGQFQEDPDLLRGRILASLKALKNLPDVDATKLGAIGFCFGGQCALELARTGSDTRAVVSLHGTLKTRRPAVAGEVKARALVLTGALDPFAPPEDIAAFQAEMSAADVDYHLTIYGRGYHAFAEPGVEKLIGIPGLRYDPVLDALSWASTTAFLAAGFADA